MVLSALPGLEGLKEKLEHIQKECNPTKAEETKSNEQKDEFLRVKEKCYGMLTIVREKIRFRFGIMKERGNNVEAIQIGVKIQSMISEMEKMLPVLQNLLSKQSGGSFMRRRLKPEEIEARYKDLAVLKNHVQDCKSSYNGNRDLEKEDFEDAWAHGPSDSETGQRGRLFGAASNIRIDETGRGVGDDEREVIDRWEARDKEFDNILDEIAIDIDQLGQHAANIGGAAERHGVLINEVGKKVDIADEGVKALSDRVKDIITQDKNSTCVCRIILMLALVAVAGIILQKTLDI